MKKFKKIKLNLSILSLSLINYVKHCDSNFPLPVHISLYVFFIKSGYMHLFIGTKRQFLFYLTHKTLCCNYFHMASHTLQGIIF